MRDLNECQAEVFRRSENRIKERKLYRKHALMACVPLVLCISLLLIDPIQGSPKDPGPAGTDPGSMVQESQSCTIAAITVSGHGFSTRLTKASDILQICNLLESRYLTPPAAGPKTEDMQPDKNIADSANGAYAIILHSHSGEQTEYRLTGNTLENCTTGEIHVLSQAQVKQLHKLLGISTQ